MLDDTAALIDRVRSLLGVPVDELARARADARADLEETLTDGYARALALEAESRHLDGRIVELAGRQDGDPAERLSELAALSERRTRAIGDLSQLRAALASLREHRADVPAAEAASG